MTGVQTCALPILSNAVADRIATAGGGTGNNALHFKFNAAKNPMRGNSKNKDKKKMGLNRDEDARKQVLGEKRGHSFGVRPMGSNLEFSFEKEMESYEHIIYGDVTVSSKRVCTGRVEVVQNKEGGVTHIAKESKRVCTGKVEVVQNKEGRVTHIAKETDKKEEYVPQGVESVGEGKDENGTSAAPEEGDRRAK